MLMMMMMRNTVHLHVDEQRSIQMIISHRNAYKNTA